MRVTACFVVSFFLILVSSTAVPFDGSRKGFILGGSVGGGFDSFTQTLEFGGEELTFDRETKGAFLSDFMIGLGISEQVLLYYSNRLAWFGLTNALDQRVTISNGVSGIGISYYLNSEGNTFVTSSVGLSLWDTPFESDSSTWTGFGLSGGIGYEFSPHWSVLALLLLGNPSDSELGVTATANSMAFGVVISGIAY